MPEGITSKVRLFADDTIAYLTISSDQDGFVGNIQISLEEANGRVCFVADVVDVRSPF
jgi:hypothetical protein